MDTQNQSAIDEECLYPPTCSRCRAFCSFLDLMEGHLPQATKEKVVAYLRNGQTVNHWKGWSTCRICGCMNGTTCQSDGEFIYPQGYAHYISEHNIQPDSELLAKVLTHENSNHQWRN